MSDVLSGLSKYNHYYDPEAAKDRYERNKEAMRHQYQVEKLIGKRSPSGTLNKKKLTSNHKQMISLFISGMPIDEIAELFDVAYLTVYSVLKDPLAQVYLDEFDAAFKAEFNAMLPLVNRTIRDGLQSGGISNRLKAVDRWGKIHRVVNGGDSSENARDKTEEIHAARFRFLEQVKEVALRTGAIEAEAVIVERSSSNDS